MGAQADVKKPLQPKLRFPEFRGAEGWAVKPFDELFTVGNGRDYKHLAAGEVPVYGSGGYMLSVNDHLHDGESVCIGRKGTINNPMFLTGRFWTVDTLFYTHSFEECLPKFIYAIFQQIDWLKHNEAGGVPSLSKANIQKIQAAVPKLAEQQKIAECLSSVDALMAAQARKVDALKTHKKGLMQQLFPREGETQPRLRFPEFQNVGEWQPKTLKDIARITSGSTPLRSNLEFFADGTIPWVKTTDLNNSIIVNTEEKITQKAKARINPTDSILIAMYGGFNQIGRTGCLSFPAATNQAISVLALDRKVTLPAYVLAWLNSKVEDWKRIASSSRKDPNITSSDVGKFIIVFPELAEQQRIASCLTSLDALITAETQKFESLKTHKKGLMQQLFPSPEAIEA